MLYVNRKDSNETTQLSNNFEAHEFQQQKLLQTTHAMFFLFTMGFTWRHFPRSHLQQVYGEKLDVEAKVCELVKGV